MTILAIPDSNALWADPFLQGVIAQSISLASEHLDISLMIAELVGDELKNIVHTRLQDTNLELGKLTHDAQVLKLAVTFPLRWELSKLAHEALDEFDTFLQSHNDKNGSLQYPTVSTQELANLAIKRRAPFQERDRGLRDTLLWTSICDAAKTGDDIYVLISKDKIFWSKDRKHLNDDLQTQLMELNLEGRVNICETLADFLQEYVTPNLKPAEAVQVAIDAKRIPDFTGESDEVALVISDDLMSSEIPQDWNLGSDYDWADFDVVNYAELEDIVSTSELDGANAVLVTSQWRVQIALILTNYYGPINNEGYLTVEVACTIQTLVDAGTLEARDHEVTDYDLNGWYDPETKEYISL